MKTLDTFRLTTVDEWRTTFRRGRQLLYATYVDVEDAKDAARELLSLRLVGRRKMAGYERDRHKAKGYLKSRWDGDSAKHAVIVDTQIADERYTVEEEPRGRLVVSLEILVRRRHATAPIVMETKIDDGQVTQTHTIGEQGRWSQSSEQWEHVAAVNIVSSSLRIVGSADLVAWVKSARDAEVADD